METVIEGLLVLALVIINGFFVATEYAVVKLRTAQLDDLLQKRDPRAQAAKEVRDRLDTFLSATQVGITLVSLALGWIGEPLMSQMLDPVFAVFNLSPGLQHSIAFALGFFVLTSLHIVFGEQIPKIIAINYEVEVSLQTTRWLIVYYNIFRPLIWLLARMVKLVTRVFGLPNAADDEGHTREELRGVFMESARRGVVKREESSMMQSLFEFGETITREIMVHRGEVIALDLDLEPREILRTIEDEGYSRLPVYRNSLDEISGVLHVKDIIPYLSQLERLSVPSAHSEKEFFVLLERAVRPALFVSETQRISDLLLDFQKNRMHMGVVVSEHGGVEGIVTLEDILEELVGEIRDESDVTESRGIIEVGDAVYVEPTISVSDFNERFHGRFPDVEESGDYQTISGYVQKQAGRIPEVGDIIEANGLKFTITRKVRHKLQQIKIELAQKEAVEDEETTKTSAG